MLKDLNLTGPELSQIATLTGQDHISNVKGFGSVAALEICSSLDASTVDEAWINLERSCPAAKNSIEQSKLVYGMFEPGIAGTAAPELGPNPFQTKSLFQMFLDETKTDLHGNIVLRRGSLKDKVSKGIRFKEVSSKITAAERRLKMIQQRKTMVAKVVKDKSFVFHFNPYSLVSEGNNDAFKISYSNHWI